MDLDFLEHQTVQFIFLIYMTASKHTPLHLPLFPCSPLSSRLVPRWLSGPLASQALVCIGDFVLCSPPGILSSWHSHGWILRTVQITEWTSLMQWTSSKQLAIFCHLPYFDSLHISSIIWHVSWVYCLSPHRRKWSLWDRDMVCLILHSFPSAPKNAWP